jgi:hypothetical protein
MLNRGRICHAKFVARRGGISESEVQSVLQDRGTSSKFSYIKNLLRRLAGEQAKVLCKVPWWARPFPRESALENPNPVPAYQKPVLRKVTLEQARPIALGNAMIKDESHPDLILLLFPERSRPDEPDAA